MWIEKVENSKGIRYKYTERFTNPATDKTIRISVTLNSKTRHAQKEAAAMLQDKYQDKYIIKPNAAANKRAERLASLTFSQVAAEWLEHIEPTIKNTTMILYMAYVKHVENNIPAGMPFNDFTSAQLEKVVSEAYYTKKLKYDYVKYILVAVKNIFRYAQKANYIKDITGYLNISIKKRPATAEELHKINNKFLNHDELHSCIEQLKQIQPRIALAMEFIALTGLRCGELLALRVQDYDKKQSCISVNGTVSRIGSSINRGTPKNNYSYRTVFLNERACHIIEWFILENKKAAQWRRKTYIDRGYIFTGMNGKPYSIIYLNIVLKKVHISGKTLTTHIFRHTHISILAGLGLPLKTIMQRVGHNNPNTTLKIYTHVTESMKAELTAKINKIVV